MILLTGATGMIGRSVADLLSQSRMKVRIAARHLTPDPVDEPFVAWPLDVSDAAATTAALNGVRYVIHLAGTAPGRTATSGFDELAMRNLVSAAKASGELRRFVFLSASGAVPGSPIPWLRDKARAESVLMASGLPWVVLRAGLVYDPNDLLVNALGKVATESSAISLPHLCRGRLRPLSAGDLAIACVTSIDHHAIERKVVEVGEAQALSLQNLIELVLKRRRRAQVRVVRRWLRPSLARQLQVADPRLDDPQGLLRWFSIAQPKDLTLYDRMLPMRRAAFAEKLREYPWGAPPPRPGEPLPVIQQPQGWMPPFIVAPHLREAGDAGPKIPLSRLGRVDPFGRPEGAEAEPGEGDPGS